MKEVTLTLLTRRLWKHRRWVFLLPFFVGMVVYVGLKMCLSYYRSQSVFRMEPKSSEVAADLHGVATMQGFDVGDVHSYTDGVNPNMYKYLIRSDSFTDELLELPVINCEGERLLYSAHLGGSTLEENRELAHKAIVCGFNTSKALVVVNVSDADSRVCAAMADSVRDHLCNWLLDYRTRKYQERVNSLAGEVARAHAEYLKAQEAYTAFSDSHYSVAEGSVFATQAEELSDVFYRRFNDYRATFAQWQNAQFQLQERAPVRMVMRQGAVSIKPAGPSAMFHALMLAALAFVFTSIWLIRRELWAQFVI